MKSPQNWPRPFKFDIGTQLRDTVTGFEGVVMGRTQYHTGCNHYGLLSRKLSKEGKPTDWLWFDESLLTQTGKGVSFKVKEPTSGLFPNPPQV